jgi:hypothetical protein
MTAAHPALIDERRMIELFLGLLMQERRASEL